MTLTVENESRITLQDIDPEDLAARVMEAALDYEGCPYEVEVSLLLTDNSAIRRINREHRRIDRPTDVLSFPMLEYREPSDFSAAESGVCGCFNPETGELVLGDIVLSLEKVREQARKYGHSEKREFAFLIAHSMLHLFGYDHETSREAAVMEQKQAAVLSSLNITR
ncbi:MAG: rRNA maturation RNase YbeY [Lachnospiraceae bacterium]|nr:rRNA maturation RNase YbeY [Lachnospiraceae bacterium]